MRRMMLMIMITFTSLSLFPKRSIDSYTQNHCKMAYNCLGLDYRATFARSDRPLLGSSLNAITVHGAGVSYDRYNRLSHRSPLFLNVGVSFSYFCSGRQAYYDKVDNHYSWYRERSTAMMRYLSASVPLTVGYELPFGGSSLCVMPVVGMAFMARFCIKGELQNVNNFQANTLSYNLSKKGDWSPTACNPVNLAPLVGINLRYRWMCLSLCYVYDIMPTYKRKTEFPMTVRTSTLDVCLSYSW